MAIEVHATTDELTRAAAERIVTSAESAISARGRFSIALSGGHTPRPVYGLLATPAFATRIDWPRVDVFWGDERCVPPDHPESNYRMVHEALLDRVPIPDANVHRIAGEREPAQGARNYEAQLRAYFTTPKSFDFVLLGMGGDGHTASLFPGSPALAERQHWVVATRAPDGMHRISLTPPVLNAAAHIVALVAGADKAGRVAEAVDGRTPPHLPIQHIRPTHGSLVWLLDAAASRLLPH